MNDILKPKHYTQGNVECLDAIDSMLEECSRIEFYRTQIVKYMWRLRDKGDALKNAKKAEFYFFRLIQKLE
mgnify:CR=1 FL=1